ncbi:MAG: ribosome recycling factor [Proteobacteria bacterium]|nr:ribosome recycling factor [Pseudomonadota bacterium]
MDNTVFDKSQEKMKKALEAFRHELSKLRTGRASLAVLDDVRVEYYGTQTPLNQLATMSVPDPRTIVIQPWDHSAASAIEKAIQKADLGLNPANDGKVIRLPVPPLNEERRIELVKVIKKHGEDCKVIVRNVRRDANEELKVLKKASEITEDEERKAHDRVQKLTDDFIKQVDDAIAHKEKDVMQL